MSIVSQTRNKELLDKKIRS
ncbi:type III secretion system filament chaperone, partial [Escherichia coli]|nr:hypothetical protein [Escherichia coli]EEZ1766763.1 hypothetical protein [Escherichia coli]EFF3991178.1 hypothetical protein [Escherichia coli]EHT2850222.1 type III secretion system filament chaperone [Escherichia coli]EIJ6664323.1 type III secretion system filament chaperone [Escherichia coli]